MSHGFRMRARELVTLELGPEIESDMTLKLAREVEAERFTRLDRALLDHTKRGFLAISAMPPAERQTHAAHMGRLRKLEQLGLVREFQTGVWEIPADSEPKLKSIGTRGDIIKTMHRALRESGIDRPAGSFALFDPAKPNTRIVGRVAGIGLTDEINDRHYVVIDGTDGKVHYADVGHLPPELVPERGMIAAIDAQTGGEDQKPRTRLRILSYLNLEKLVAAEGATWLDKQLLNRKPESLSDQGFGAEASGVLARRRQWLLSQGLAQLTPDGALRPVPGMLDQLRQKDLRQASVALSKELGLAHIEPSEGERVSGTYERSIHLASGRFAVVQMTKEFALVPWQQSFEGRGGRHLLGFRTREGFEWGQSRSIGLGLGN